MLKHIVMWKLKDEAEGADLEENAQKLKAMLEELPAMIPAIRKLEVGINTIPSAEAFDMALVTEFDDSEGLEEYLKHPEHVRVAGFIGKIRSGRAVVDYLIP